MNVALLWFGGCVYIYIYMYIMFLKRDYKTHGTLICHYRNIHNVGFYILSIANFWLSGNSVIRLTYITYYERIVLHTA